METIIRSVRKATNTIDVMILGMIGTVNTQAKSSTMLKLNIDWLSSESAPTRLIAPIMIEMTASPANGAMK